MSSISSSTKRLGPDEGFFEGGGGKGSETINVEGLKMENKKTSLSSLSLLKF